MRAGHPLPPVPYKWYGYRQACAGVWIMLYTQQLDLYNQICNKNSVGSSMDTVNLYED